MSERGSGQAALSRKLRNALIGSLDMTPSKVQAFDASLVPPRTARQLFEIVGQRIQVPPNAVETIFASCMRYIFEQCNQSGRCTVRGLGSFSMRPDGQLMFQKSREPARKAIAKPKNQARNKPSKRAGQGA